MGADCLHSEAMDVNIEIYIDTDAYCHVVLAASIPSASAFKPDDVTVRTIKRATLPPTGVEL